MIRYVYYSQRNGGKWRKARVQHRCDWKVAGIRCIHQIRPGERYFDTNLFNPQSTNPHGTYRICEHCANESINI